MTHKSQLGNLGENIACQYLIKKGYRILERNFRKPWGELDIIAKAPDKTLVFVEVKTVTGVNGNSGDNCRLPSTRALGSVLDVQPEEQLTRAKLQKLKRTSSLYAGHFQEKIDDEKGWRIDLLALTLQKTSGSILSKSNRLTISPKDCLINHYENIH
ncbi:MAG TPA: hypothetical protein ENH26_02380 [Candidatus Wolfebacteria bacterium]|nr:hypothetical protein [Candidatus Wolfebacteria bacterium]